MAPKPIMTVKDTLLVHSSSNQFLLVVILPVTFLPFCVSQGLGRLLALWPGVQKSGVAPFEPPLRTSP